MDFEKQKGSYVQRFIGSKIEEFCEKEDVMFSIYFYVVSVML